MPDDRYGIRNKGADVGADAKTDDARLVGSDRVLAVLIELAQHPAGATLDEIARGVDSSKPTVHRALGSLRRSGLAIQLARGIYALGDEFFRLAFQNFADRPETLWVTPLLTALARRFGETAHYAVLDGAEVIYRAKIDPTGGAVRLSSVVGGRNPAYRTAVGKLMLSHEIDSERELRSLLGPEPLEKRTPNTIVNVSELWDELKTVAQQGYAVDDQENEMGVNCVAVPLPADFGAGSRGAVSVSALTFRTPLADLIAEVPTILAIIDGRVGARDQ